ncbi:NTP transferase domain-containing protein [Haloplanus sp. C73]|uniref:NTP transferase domain-containing protein n=1 Tax=Haloplanus sp. C73 TaxID=3421641 RepID=UPI003EBE4549
MCGGRGTRLGGETEKPLVTVAGTPTVDRVCDALATSRVDTVYAAVSPHTPETRAHLSERDPTVIDTPGEGYVADLTAALDRVGRPALTVAADLPLLAAEAVDDVLDAATGSLVVAVPVALKRRLGVSVDTTLTHAEEELAPSGVNVVAETDDDIYVSDDPRLAVNVNRPTDRWVAEALS